MNPVILALLLNPYSSKTLAKLLSFKLLFLLAYCFLNKPVKAKQPPILLSVNKPFIERYKPKKDLGDRFYNSPYLLVNRERMKKTDKAQQILQQALEAANNTSDPQTKARLLLKIAKQYQTLGQTEQANAILSQALITANSLENPSKKAQTLATIAVYYQELGNQIEATKTFSQALTIANSIADPAQKANILAEIALDYAKLEQYDRSLALLSQSQTLAQAASTPFPFQPKPWQVNLGLGGTLSSSDTTTSLATFSGDIERQWKRNFFETDFYISNDFDSNREEDENQISGVLNSLYTYNYSEKWEQAIRLRMRTDEDVGLNFSSLLVAGPGVTLWRDGAEQFLNLRLGILGIGYVNYADRPSELEFPLAGIEIHYEDIFANNLKFSQDIWVAVPVFNAENNFMQSVTTLSIPINSRWSFDNSAFLVYYGEPFDGKPNLRLDLVTGLKYQF